MALEWQEVGCLTLIAIVVLCTSLLHCRLQGEGHMGWNTVHWSSLSLQRKGKPNLRMAGVRLLLAAALAGEMLYDWDEDQQLWGTLSFVNQLAVMVYLGVAGLSCFLVLDGTGWGHTPVARSASWAMWVLFEVIFSCSLMVAFLYWVYLVPEACVVSYVRENCEWVLSSPSLTQHVVTVLFVLAEGAWNRFFFRLEHQVFVSYAGSFMALWQMVITLRTGKVHYSFLDPTRPVTMLLGLVCLSIFLACFQIGRAWTLWCKPDCEALQDEEVEALKP